VKTHHKIITGDSRQKKRKEKIKLNKEKIKLNKEIKQRNERCQLEKNRQEKQ